MPNLTRFGVKKFDSSKGGKLKKHKILFVYRHPDTFVKKDLDILKEKYEVIPFHTTKNLLKTTSKLVWDMRKVNLVFIWFAGWHAFLAVIFAKIFKKKSVVVAGGYDVAYVPEINYGVFCSWWRGRLAKWVLENADIILPFSEYSKKEVLKNANPKQIETVYLGFDSDKYKPRGKKVKSVITVATVSKCNVLRKGLITIVESAKYLPNVQFLLVGKHSDESINVLKSHASSNIKFTGFLPFNKLLSYYQRAEVYLELLVHTGFGCAIAEAMLCGCVPVVTKIGSLPEVVGNVGFYVAHINPKETAETLKKALKSNKGKKARNRIKKLFRLDERKKELVSIIEKLNEK